jgi:5-formyltetrahydrofolate cyclo-ligase
VVTKDALRIQISTARRAYSEVAREQARAGIRRAVLQQCQQLALPAGSRIAGYEPLHTEPGSVELLAELSAAGFQVIVPITLVDNDLDWRLWQGDRSPLGLAAVGQARLVLVPAFAVDPAGNRLGRGGGSYDRALARIADGVPVAALLFADEIVEEVPVVDWDRPVSAVVTPAGWQSVGRG